MLAGEKVKEIALTQGKFALVDDTDYERLNKFKWFTKRYKNSCYAARNGNKRGDKLILMHRIILNTPEDMETDHIDGDGLNNQKSNLRVVTKKQNGQNQTKRQYKTSPLSGVCKAHGTKWKARLVREGVCKHLGCFDTEEEAHLAYINALSNIGESPIESCKGVTV